MNFQSWLWQENRIMMYESSTMTTWCHLGLLVSYSNDRASRRKLDEDDWQDWSYMNLFKREHLRDNPQIDGLSVRTLKSPSSSVCWYGLLLFLILLMVVPDASFLSFPQGLLMWTSPVSLACRLGVLSSTCTTWIWLCPAQQKAVVWSCFSNTQSKLIPSHSGSLTSPWIPPGHSLT